MRQIITLRKKFNYNKMDVSFDYEERIKIMGYIIHYSPGKTILIGIFNRYVVLNSFL